MPEAVHIRAGILERVRVDRALLRDPPPPRGSPPISFSRSSGRWGTGTSIDDPGFTGITPGEQASFHFEFEGGPVDACNGRTPVGQQATWIVDGKFP
jgi:hypothetical protein